MIPGLRIFHKDKDGTPIMQKPYHKLQKNLTCLMLLTMLGVFPLGHDIRKTGADVVIYSMDKASGSSTSGLIIGKEEVMVPIRRALGMHGDRWGNRFIW